MSTKKIIVIAIQTAALIVLPGCGQLHDRAEIMGLVDGIWNRGDLSLVEKLISPEFVLRSPGQEDVKGIEAYKRHISRLRTAFPDLRLTFIDSVMEGNRSATHWTMSGTQTGIFRLDGGADIPPTGKKATIHGVSFSTWKEGKLVEEFSVSDVLGAFQQLGLLPSPPAK